ncbi:hypothetical protein GCM10028862_23480 [Luteimonas pelagia]
MRNAILLSGLIALAAAFAAHAETTAEKPDLAFIRAQQIELRGLIEKKEGVFADISEVERNELVVRQNRLLATLDGVAEFTDLSKEDQFEVFNELEWINATVNDARGAQVVCEYVRKTGSHRKVKECKTVAQRDADREASLEAMREFRETYGLPNN